MSQIIQEAGIRQTFRLFEYDYRRYKNKIPNNAAGLKEQLYFIEKNYDGEVSSQLHRQEVQAIAPNTSFVSKQINTFVDLFAGGLDVSINVDARRIVCNDINNYVMRSFWIFQKKTSIDNLTKQIQLVIEEYQLNETKQRDGYNSLRKEYDPDTPTASPIHACLCCGFNHQFRFNDGKKESSTIHSA